MNDRIIDAHDLAGDTLGGLMPGRPVRSYPALLATEAEALRWARAGGPSGAVVTAGYQASARGHGGLPWYKDSEGPSMGFSLLLRPDLAAQREGWLYLVSSCAVGDLLGWAARYQWPDTVRGDGAVGRVAVQSEVVDEEIGWAVVSVFVHPVELPRGPLLAHLVERIEHRAGDDDDVLAVSRRRCTTLGSRVRARIVPMGPRGIVIDGVAIDLDDEGSLVVERDGGRRQPVHPQDLGRLELADAEADA